jgi:SPOR domain
MANTPLTGEIWHLSVDDLLAPLPETTRLGGTGPFVINLTASSAPISLPVKGIAGAQHAHVYQIQRVEDRRTRYRLRLGPFAKEDEADAVLKKVRDIYPGALTATADADDLRAIATLQAKAGAQSSAEKSAVSSQPVAATSAASLTPAPSAAPTASVTPMAFAAPTVPAKPAPSSTPAASLTPAPSVKPMVPAMPTASAIPTVERRNPVRVTAPVPTLSASVPVPRQAEQPGKRVPGLETTPTASAKPAPSIQPPVPARPTVSPRPVSATPTASAIPTVERRNSVRVPAAVPTLSAPVPRESEQPSKHVPSLESTQTVRALTQLELEDDNASRWFVIQLSLAEETFDPDTVPNLDIFSVYRLYSVAGIDQGRIVHALRLGFFTEEIAAGAVASYLGAFYDKPTIKRVSAAERERFAEQSLEPRKDVGATGKHAAIEITSERFVRERRNGQTAAK